MDENEAVRLRRGKKKKRLSGILYTVFILLIACVFLYQIYKINCDPVKTQVALFRTVTEHLDTRAFIVRDEKLLIVPDVSGTLVPLAEDGKRVARGDDVAVVFENEASARVYNALGEVEKDIAYFSSLRNRVGMQTFDAKSLSERIYSAGEAYIEAIDRGAGEADPEYENALRDAITSRQLSTGTVIDPSEKLVELKSRRDRLRAQGTAYTTVAADHPGYYISRVDGYENAVDYEKASEIPTGELEALLDGSVQPQARLSGCMGKLVDGFNWYLLCLMDYEQAAKLELGNALTVEFTSSAAAPVEAQVVGISGSADGKASAVLKCSLMNTQYAALRLEHVRLIFHTYDGLEIDNRAIREEDGQKGVYVRNGNIVKFKKINIVHADSERSVCVAPEGEKGWLRLYDEVIVEGTELYDGKVLR